MKRRNWFLPALKPQRVGQVCSGCDAPAIGWDARANPFCCEVCMRAVETPARPRCRCAFRESQRRVLEASA